MNQSKKMKFLYFVVVLVIAGLLALGISKNHNMSENKNQKIEPRLSRDQKDINEQNLDSGKFRIVNDIPGSYYLSKDYHKKYFPSSKIWSSVPASGKLEGSYFYPYAVKTLKGALLFDITRPKIEDKFVLADISADGLNFKTSTPVDEVRLKDFSDLMVTFEYWGSGNLLYETKMGQGLPYVQIYPKSIKEFTVNLGRFELEKNYDGVEMVYEKNRVLLDNYKSKSVNDRDINIELENDKPLTIGFYQGAENRETIKQGADVEVAAIWADYAVKGDNIITQYSLTDALNNPIKTPVPFGFLPHHNRTDKSLFSMEIIRGEQKFYPTISYTNTIPMEKMVKELNFEIPQKDRELIVTELKKDIEDLEIESTTGYFGGKALARAARLIEISRVFEEKSLEFMATEKLKKQLETWYNDDGVRTKQYFEWEKESGGIIAQQKSFGSEEYNDHHFHYGYFLYANSVIAEKDPDFIKKYKDFVDLLAYDIANLDRNNEAFPYVRTFDFYENHSWASGWQPFASGNNQESTSEAINAWYSLWRWGEVTGNENFKEAGKYLYSSEINSAEYYWLNGIDGRQAFPEGYKYKMASLIWGGKLEYATFFSPDPRSIEGIQYLPITPGATYLQNPTRNQRDYDFYRERGVSLTEGALVDYNVAYYGIFKGWDVLDRESLAKLPIDDGNSRTNLYYWLSYWDSKK
jgi:hypothetical protein